MWAVKTVKWQKQRDHFMHELPSLAMNGRLWCKVQFTVQVVDDESRSIVAAVLKPHQSSAGCTRDMRAPWCDDSGNRAQPIGNVFFPEHTTSAGPEADEWCDQIILPCTTDKMRRCIEYRLKMVKRVTRNTIVSSAAIIHSYHDHAIS